MDTSTNTSTQKLTQEGRAYVKRLEELRELLNASDPDGREMSNTQFAIKYLPYSESTWIHLRQDDYTGNTKEMERRSLAAIIKIEQELESRGITINTPLYKTDIVKSVLEHVASARNIISSPNRLVVYLAETGGGKTALCRHIAATWKGNIVEGRESWRASYTSGCRDVAVAAGATKDDKMRNAREAEEVMLRHLRARRMVLCIDEANSFGPHTCNMVKLILNQTPTVIFLGSIPGLWEKMNQANWFEASQLQRRAVAVVRLAKLTAAEARPFLKPVIEDKELLTAACRRVADSATEFGLFDRVERITRYIADETTGTGNPVTMEAVAKAIAITRAATPAK
jgi:DNA transposition AAA+ family ATPase